MFSIPETERIYQLFIWGVRSSNELLDLRQQNSMTHELSQSWGRNRIIIHRNRTTVAHFVTIICSCWIQWLFPKGILHTSSLTIHFWWSKFIDLKFNSTLIFSPFYNHNCTVIMFSSSKWYFVLSFHFQGNIQGKAVPVPSAYISKYNNYIDTIFERINNVLKKNYDPVNVRLQTAPSQKKKPGAAKHSSKYKKRHPARPSSRDDEWVKT